MNINLKKIFYLIYKSLFYPELSLFLLFSYIFDIFLEYHFGNTYLKKILFLPVILYAQFLGRKLFDKIMLSNENQINFDKKNKILVKEKEINIMKLKYLDIGNKVNNLKI
jgi:Fe-S cluster biosynthesis and repair protein YggX